MATGINELRERFGFHPGTPDSIPRHEQIRSSALHFALILDEVCPDSREKSLAMTALQEAAMWANASVAIHVAPLADR